MLAAPCPSAAHAARLPALRAPLRADVDADGHTDVVTIRLARRAPVTCGLLLAVRTRTGTHAARIYYGGLQFDTAGRLVSSVRFPFVNGALALDRRPGLEIVVTAWEGASNSFLQLFALRHGSLVRLRLPAPDGPELSWGGFAEAFGGLDCAAGGLRATSASYVPGHHWRVDRVFYRIGERAVRVVRTQTFRGGGAMMARFSRELSQRMPFPSCRGIRARRQL